MDENKAWAPIIVLLVIMSGAFVLFYFDKVDKAAAELDVSMLQLQQAKAALESQQRLQSTRAAQAEKSKSLLLQIQSAEARLAEAEKKQDAAESKRRLIEGDLRYLSEAVRKQAATTLERIAETEFPEIRLSSGRVLKNVRLRKLDDTKCSFVHTDGIGTAMLSELPADLLERIDVGPAGIAIRLKELEVELGLVAQPAQTASNGSSTRLEMVRRRMAELESRIASTTAHKNKLEDEVRDLGVKIIQMSGRGGSTFNLQTLRDVAEGNAGMTRNELTLLESELKKLRLENDKLTSEQR
jgi:septal ring factor EnvC (AmiA/AmiB activator)